ncbi:hypothetical protein IEQ34_021628 [Dendrobium chrysotoxum]|uniref:UBZ4-type domain-containing protein n=1 Tax=Dendrobium chrysotoxum TaxID=161865 RepID=A0AAV7G423_DENCH|nr:hypothetical protein IEQ34_021628 [Dendrobium chrysotoxum]
MNLVSPKSTSLRHQKHGRIQGAPPLKFKKNRLLLPPRPFVAVTKGLASFDAYEPLVTSSERSTSAAITVECLICSSLLPSEESIFDHLDCCIDPSAYAGTDAGVANCVSGFLSGELVEASVEIVVKMSRNVGRELRN